MRCGVKWPNDVWIADRKLAGVLIESRPGADGWAVIGVGLNVAVPRAEFPADLTGTATSLLAEGAADATVEAARGALNDALGHWLDAPEGEVLAEFRARDALAGRRVGWERDAGVVAGIDDSGHLLVDTDRGERVALGAGEVHLAVS